MAPWPRLLEQLAVTYLSGFLAQRMSRSPAILRAADRIRHEMDHLPHRLEGKPVPKYIVRDFDPPETTWIGTQGIVLLIQTMANPTMSQSEQRAMEFRELQEQLRRMK
ncbi:hypothetical protein MVES_003496 [Malassezia vespertilionis]|uniref:Uncharacterized protein n=1 Tax=Malassezia vespertilionis TaxID=2020962 RepID=A0A2N1J859_9BASI|nr:hypothetical protein MVES_003496 [Malassezia vespertilionis]